MVIGPDRGDGGLVNIYLLDIQNENVLVHDRHHTINISLGNGTDLELLGRSSEVTGSCESDGGIENGATRIEFVSGG